MRITNIFKFYFFAILIILLNFTNLEAFESLHQFPREFAYCSIQKCSVEGAAAGCKPTDYLCLASLKGFKDQYNINNPITYCGGQSSCTLGATVTLGNSFTFGEFGQPVFVTSFKVYIPPGTIGVAISLYGMETDSALGVEVRFGATPDYNFPVPFNYDALPMYYNGWKVPEVKDETKIVKNSDGILYVTNRAQHEMITEGGWLYVGVFGAGTASGINYNFTVNVAAYKKWYDSAQWNADGDPKDVTNYILSVNPTSQSIPSTSGNFKIAVSNAGSGTMAWTSSVTSGSNWLSITSGNSGKNAGDITCSYQANTGANSRTATVRVVSNEASGSPKDITVTQIGTVLLIAKPETVNVTKDAGTALFIVSNVGTGTMPWTASVTSGTSWLKITSGTSGNSGNIIKCSYDTNTTSAKRTGIIRITSTGAMGSPKDVKVIQQ